MQPLRYIAFEGVEGSGKSTQAKMLAEALGGRLTRENGGTAVGQRIRSITHDPELTMSNRTEALLFAADRAQHIDEVVMQNLGRGKAVVSDRSLWSSVAYQGYGRGLPVFEIEKVSRWATDDVIPGIVVVLTVSSAVRKQRLSERLLDRIEGEDDNFFDRVATGFQRMSSWADGKWVYVDGERPPLVVANDIKQNIIRIFKEAGALGELPSFFR